MEKAEEIFPQMVQIARKHILAAYRAGGMKGAREAYKSYRNQEAFDEINEMLRMEPIPEIVSKKQADSLLLSEEEIKGIRDNLDSFFRALEKKDKEKKK